ncbi:hypothetical protein PoB_002441400 [Plakobranchus ocellatus]|uniref:G-protein coupled receptors family 2 profile 2 domain-containing protein n=1 Tax=Plakobranchus ocellatus TaxID=259542 RepID=A0AAV3ZU31_9GAST|nr:hypothetical protein PoB_002441400 [Plakobranchus ocellatus]
MFSVILNTGAIQFEFLKVTGVTQSRGTHQTVTTPPSLSINGEKVSVFEQSKQKNVTNAIKEVKNLLESITSITTKDLSIIADILQQIDGSERTLSPSSVQDALDVVSLISDLPVDNDLVSSKTRANSSNRILQAVDNLGAALQLPEGKTSQRFVSGEIALEVWEIGDQPEGSATVIGLQNYINEESNSSVRLVMNVYKDTRLYSQAASASKSQTVRGQNRTLNSGVIAAQLLVDGKQVKDLRGRKVVAVFKPTRLIQPDEKDKFETSCEFWDYSANSGFGDWNPEGYENSKTEQGRIICQCNHLANFAVLMTFYDQTQLEHKKALGYIILAGLIVSIIGIALSMLSFLCIKKLRKSHPQQVMLQLSTALLLSWIVFLAGIDRTSDHGPCIATAAILHYLILASFLWMLMEGILQYLLLVKVMTSNFSHFWWKTAFLSWGVPAIPVITTLAIDPELYRGGKYYCWMGSQVFKYELALPVALIVFANLTIFVLVCLSDNEAWVATIGQPEKTTCGGTVPELLGTALTQRPEGDPASRGRPYAQRETLRPDGDPSRGRPTPRGRPKADFEVPLILPPKPCVRRVCDIALSVSVTFQPVKSPECLFRWSSTDRAR